MHIDSQKMGKLQGKEIGGDPAKANLPRLLIFYTFYMFYTAITTPLPLSNSNSSLQLFPPLHEISSAP